MQIVATTSDWEVLRLDDSKKFGGGQYYNVDAIGKNLDCPITSYINYRCFDPDRELISWSTWIKILPLS
jgi:hypothetical protein